MDTVENDLLKILNSSGFPFQIGLRKEIDSTYTEHGWKVEVEEHRWNHRELRESGYIDLVVRHDPYIFTVLMECKRVRDGKWIFLTPQDSAADASRLSAFYTAQGTDHDAEDGGGKPRGKGAKDLEKDIYWWADAQFAPASKEAAFCVMKGQDERNPMLERIADGLLPAVEAVGLEHLELTGRGRRWGDNRLFLPVIVTNAELWAGAFDPAKISMASGELEADSCNFTRVPFIRFRKSLSTHYPSYQMHAMSYGRGDATLRHAGLANERTILIIHSPAITETLKQLAIPNSVSTDFGMNLFAMARTLRGGQ